MKTIRWIILLSMTAGLACATGAAVDESATALEKGVEAAQDETDGGQASAARKDARQETGRVGAAEKVSSAASAEGTPGSAAEMEISPDGEDVLRMAGLGAEASELISVQLEKVELEKAINIFSRLSGVNIIVPELEEVRKPVTVNLDEVPWKPALETILSSYNLELHQKVPGTEIYTIRQRPADAPEPEPVRVFSLSHANTESVKKVLEGLAGKDKVYTYPEGNTIVVQGDATVMEDIEAVVKAVDRPREQVFVEANIFELEDVSSDQLGIDWEGSGEGNDGLAGLDVDLGSPQFEQRDLNEFIDLDQTRVATLAPGDLNVLLNALRQRSDVKQVSSPRLVVGNGQQANIRVVTKEPNLEVETTFDDEGNPVATSTKMAFNQATPEGFFIYGIELDVTPTINTESNITVQIVPTISRELVDERRVISVGEEIGNEFPVIREKKVETTFILGNGRTAVIGGLTEELANDTVNKIPLLGDIPVLGKFLFRSTEKKTTQTENIIFVKVGIQEPEPGREYQGIHDSATLTRRQLIRRDRRFRRDAAEEELLRLQEDMELEQELERIETRRKALERERGRE
ncbi:type II secretion system protein GspD [Kiritimatiella glycovorans]|uniref:Type IV pilus biogenesis and competence protein PilQ n=1 Tax=Kiritimatiella glycovorans TaxID=1307763 RepID=A0A0G3EDS8_9BACT|nr:secretin N-terminal domain-containing protein [Kiritimatiella glycovorans]AKJ63562.1 Type IV pilus biogenesis and competence protein PilQ precursor [Kiritimatiella glycovorans]